MISNCSSWFRRAILALYWLAMILATHLPDIDEYTPDRIRGLPDADKFVHCGMYFGWMLLWSWVLSAGGRAISRRALILLFAGGAVWGVLDETTQAFVRRQPDIWDYACDLAGVTMGLIMVAIHARRTPVSTRAWHPEA